MAFVVLLRPGELPALDALCAAASDRIGMDVHLDEQTALAGARGDRFSSWCPWPHPGLALFVPGATTRGVEVTASSDSALRVSVPALATWADWRLGLAVAGILAGPVGSTRVEGEGEFLDEGLLRHFEHDDRRYLAECASGASSVVAAAREGRIARIGGPAGHASIGPRTWMELVDQSDDPEELPLLLVERIQASIEARGFEDYHHANPMWLDGRGGQEVLAVVLAPGHPTLLRDPEYVLLGEDLEAGEASMFLLPFEHLEAAFPGEVRWLDDRTAALAAIPAGSWADRLAAIRPMLSPVADVLDR